MMVKQFHLLDAQTCFLRVGFRWSVETWQNKRRILHPNHELNPTGFFFHVDPIIKCFSQYENGTTVCSQRDFHAPDTSFRWTEDTLALNIGIREKY